MGEQTAKRAVWFLALVYFLFFGSLVFLKSAIYQNADDTVLYTQALWSTLQGDPFATTWRGAGGPGGLLLGLHFELTLILLAPVYALWTSPDPLLLIQVLFIALTAYPVYTCAAHLLRSPAAGLLVALAHLANPFVQRALFYDFHHEFMVYFALVWAASSLIQGRTRLFLGAALLAALSREDALVHVFVLGLLAILLGRQWKLGLGTMAASVIGFLLITEILIPHFRGAPNQIFASRYPELGQDMPGIIRTVLFKPGTIYYLIRDPDNLRNVLHALLPFAFLPVLSLPGIVLVAPAIAEMVLTPVPSLNRLELLYPFVVMPLFPFAALASLARLSERLRFREPARLALCALVAILSLYSMLFYDGRYVFGEDRYHAYYLKQFPIARGFSWDYFLRNEHERIGRRFIATHIPEKIPLATEYRFAADLSNRSTLKPLDDLAGIELVFFDLYGQPYVEPIDSFIAILERPDFGVTSFEDGYTVLERGADRGANQTILSLMEDRFEAEDLSGETGANVPDHRCTNRVGRLGKAKRDPPGTLLSGRSRPLAPGQYELVFTMRVRRASDGPAAAEIAVIEAATPGSGAPLATRSLAPVDFPRRKDYQEIRLPFECTTAVAGVDFRLLFRSAADLWVDRVEVKKRRS